MSIYESCQFVRLDSSFQYLWRLDSLYIYIKDTIGVGIPQDLTFLSIGQVRSLSKENL